MANSEETPEWKNPFLDKTLGAPEVELDMTDPNVKVMYLAYKAGATDEQAEKLRKHFHNVQVDSALLSLMMKDMVEIKGFDPVNGEALFVTTELSEEE